MGQSSGPVRVYKWRSGKKLAKETEGRQDEPQWEGLGAKGRTQLDGLSKTAPKMASWMRRGGVGHQLLPQNGDMIQV